jgi:hypothetical protein
MKWTKQMPIKPGFYWLLEYDEQGSPQTGVVKLARMPENAEEIAALMKLKNMENTESYKGKLLVFCTGDACAHVSGDPDFTDLYWYGPLETPELPM